MPWFSRFTKLWAANGVTAEPSDTNQDLGFGYLGSNPPSVEMFNSIIQNLDAKDNWLYARIAEVIAAGGGIPSQTSNTQLIDALRGLFGPNMRAFTTNQFFGVPGGVSRIRAKCWGGGGGGGGSLNGGAGSGGAAGGYSEGIFTVTPGSSVFVSVGQGGNGAQPSTPQGGQAGGTTSFGSFLSATGGAAGTGGNVNASSAIAIGGVGIGGSLNVTGMFGGLTQNYPSGSSMAAGGGVGGSAPFGGSLSHLSINNGGNVGVFPGGGGGGAGATVTGQVGSAPGGQGANGLCILEW